MKIGEEPHQMLATEPREKPNRAAFEAATTTEAGRQRLAHTEAEAADGCTRVKARHTHQERRNKTQNNFMPARGGL